jgi:hypothetical protein
MLEFQLENATKIGGERFCQTEHVTPHLHGLFDVWEALASPCHTASMRVSIDRSDPVSLSNGPMHQPGLRGV